MGWDNPSTFDKIALDSSENFYLKFIIVKVSVEMWLAEVQVLEAKVRAGFSTLPLALTSQKP